MAIHLRHGKNANLAFADGHVESLNGQGVASRVISMFKDGQAPTNGVLMANSDLTTQYYTE